MVFPIWTGFLMVFCFQTDVPWPHAQRTDSITSRFSPPGGYHRIPVKQDSFGAWLRQLPLKPKGSKVFLYNGELKGNQSVHSAVIDMDTGKRDLQQCADAVMRLRAEYLLAQDRGNQIAFNFTSGHPARWQAWQRGSRPKIHGNKVTWQKKAAPDSGYRNFRRYLNTVFAYAGSASLARELQKVANSAKIELGDVFIQGGFPGHAVLVIDVAQNEAGERVFLLAQSYMPAQDIHILKATQDQLDGWYQARSSGPLLTPEWRFQYGDLKRFSAQTPAL